jgi:hypothetical protein
LSMMYRKGRRKRKGKEREGERERERERETERERERGEYVVTLCGSLRSAKHLSMLNISVTGSFLTHNLTNYYSWSVLSFLIPKVSKGSGSEPQ